MARKIYLYTDARRAPESYTGRVPTDAIERESLEAYAADEPVYCRSFFVGWCCTRAPEHTEDHVAGTQRHVLARWKRCRNG